MRVIIRMNAIIKKFGAFSAGPIIGACISFITIPIITGFISPDEYGRASMFTLTQTILALVIYLGLDQSYVKYFNEYKEKDVLFFNALVMPLFTSVIIDILLFGCREQVSIWLFDTPDENLCIFMLMLYLPFCILERFFMLRIGMQERGLLYSALSILIKIGILVATVILLAFYERSFRSVVYAAVLGEVTGTVVIILVGRKESDNNELRIDFELQKTLLKYGLPLIPAAIVAWILSSMDKVMIRSICDYNELGLYTAALKIVSVLGIVQQCFATFWSPIAFRWNKESRGIKNFELVGRVLIVGMSIIFVLIMTFKTVIIKLLSPEYEQAAYIMPFLLLNPVMYTVSEVTVVGIYFTGKSFTTNIVAICSCICNLGLNALLIPKWGASGAAIATGISYTLFFWLRTMISRRIWKKFDIKNYIVYTLVLLLSSTINVIIEGWIVTIFNVSLCLILIIVNLPYIFNLLKGRGLRLWPLKK